MKKIIISTILSLCACTTVDKINTSEVSASFEKSKIEFLSTVKTNNKKNIHKFFINSLKNNLILKNIDKIELTDLFIFIPTNEIKINSNKEISTLLILTYGTESAYFDVIWVKVENMWKISNIYERQN
ncbi:hypothetical protein QQA45_01020 [Sneathia sanguinegens]|uniref:DUF4878 domain-containing protein n=1 Tax=Sneathia sanguinegens TaxID=40543 RepID=A0ABT7HI01_9FUSO|nr:hypothetical protein [Sneathia sanguinegens]MDK9580113.1 hypothetical protein [Sneathia sanguinegens]